jgi:hypothetical protein
MGVMHDHAFLRHLEHRGLQEICLDMQTVLDGKDGVA